MPDITKCTGEGCSIKKTCYRFTAVDSEFRQSYFATPPFKEDGTCEHYWKDEKNGSYYIIEPTLESATFKFSQEGNCVDGNIETLEIKCESSLGIDNDGSCFFILKTKKWSIDSVKELEKLINRINKIVNK